MLLARSFTHSRREPRGVPSTLPTCVACVTQSRKQRDAWEEREEPPRAYHTLQHLGECMDLLTRWGYLHKAKHEIAVALWFHDFIYELSENGIALTPYDETETVSLYRSFLAAPAAYHHHLEHDR